jgi:hypothetical protein
MILMLDILVTIKLLGMCYILCMCVCVRASDSKNASNDSSSSVVCVMWSRHFPRGVSGGEGMPLLVTRSAPKLFFGRFLLFLVVY